MKNKFVAFSAEITAFKPYELNGTGQTDNYLKAVTDIVGQAVLNELLAAYDKLQGITVPEERIERLRGGIFGDEKLGPIARNILKLWYSGIWYELPVEWTDAYGALDNNVTHVIKPESYTEGLLWLAIGANPPGAKAPGYGSWHEPPNIPPVPGMP